MRRNDIVRQNSGAGGGFFYGRVWKILPDGMIQWICCGKHINVDKPEDLLVENEYKGYWREINFYHVLRKGHSWPEYDWDRGPRLTVNRFVRMPTLRELKQFASRYQGRDVWRK